MESMREISPGSEKKEPIFFYAGLFDIIRGSSWNRKKNLKRKVLFFWEKA